MNWLNQAFCWCARVFEEGATGNPSVKRVALIITVSALASSTIILALAAYMGKTVGLELASVATSLAGVGGYSYVRGKKVERENAPNP